VFQLLPFLKGDLRGIKFLKSPLIPLYKGGDLNSLKIATSSASGELLAMGIISKKCAYSD
jgi:hypothetical protein